MKPRPYQEAGVAELLRLFESGHRKLGLQLPTGGGKTHMMGMLAEKLIAMGATIVFGAHLRELLEQANGRLPRGVRYTTTQASTVPTGDFLFHDEGHRILAASSRALADRFKYVVAWTATMCRTDEQKLCNYLDHIHVAGTYQELVDGGYLFAPHILSHLLDDTLVGSVTDHYPRGKSGIYFAKNMVHAGELVDQFNEAGISARALLSSQSDADRKGCLTAFRARLFDVMVSVDIATEGIDVPHVEVIGLCRRTDSIRIYLQQIGRGARLCPSTGKTGFLVNDHAGNCLELGVPTKARQWEDAGEDGRVGKAGERLPPAWACIECLTVNDITDLACGFCGELRPKVKTFKTIAGQLVDVNDDSELWDAIVASWYKHNAKPGTLMPRKPGWCAWRYKKVRGSWPKKPQPVYDELSALKASVFAEYEKVRLANGYSKGWTYHKMKEAMK